MLLNKDKNNKNNNLSYQTSSNIRNTTMTNNES
jgi:hypothetical protein